MSPTHMAVPKKRQTRSRRDMRRHSSAYRMHATPTVKCGNCGSPTLSHHICGECGHYNGKQVAHVKSVEA